MRGGRHWIAAAAAVLSSGGAYYLVRGAHPMWPLAWLAPLPVLAFAFAAPAWIAAATAFAAYALGGSAIWQLAAGVVPAPLVAAFVLISAAAFMIMVLLTRHAVRRLGHWVAVFTYPILFTAWEYLNSIAGTSGSIANSQIDFPPAAQIAALIGSWGVTFLVALVPAAVAVAWQLRLQREQAAWALAVPFALCAAALAWGALRLMQPATGPVVRAGLAATDTTVRFFRTERAADALPVVAAYVRRIEELAAAGAQVVVLPEKFVGVTPAYADAVRDAFAEAARRQRVWVVAGLNRVEGPPRRNVALVFDPNGQMVLEYQKVHLVPSFEDEYSVGHFPTPFPTAAGTWGVAICRDLLYTDVGRANSLAGVGLLLVPAWDFGNDAAVMARIAAMRAVEGGFAVVRAAQIRAGGGERRPWPSRRADGDERKTRGAADRRCGQWVYAHLLCA